MNYEVGKYYIIIYIFIFIKLKTYVVNLLGGPGIGKSTIANGVFYNLKKRGINVEFASEFAKDMVFAGSTNLLRNQSYIFGNQHNRLWTLKEQNVNVIITDSPIILSIIYSKEPSLYFDDFVVEQFNKFNNINIVLKRNEKFYVPEGRVHSLEESKMIDKQIIDILDKYNITYDEYETEFAVEKITDTIIKLLNN